MQDLHSIIMDANFTGIILNLSEEYDPITIDETKPFSPEMPLYDNSLFIIDSSLNLFIFSPIHPDLLKKEELQNIKKHINKIHLRPLHLTAGEYSTSLFTNYMLLGIKPEQVYEMLTDTSIKIDPNLFKKMFIQAGRTSLIKTNNLADNILIIKNKYLYSFHPSGLDIRKYITNELLPIIPAILNSNIPSMLNLISTNQILLEGSHISYPTFKFDSNYLQAIINTYSITNPDNITTHTISINFPDTLETHWLNTAIEDYSFISNNYLGIAGYTLYFMTIKNNTFLQVIYDLRKNKGIQLITQEDYTFSEKIKHIQLTEKGLIVEDSTFTNPHIIKTPQYALYYEKYHNKIIPEEVLEKIKTQENTGYNQNILKYNEMFGVMVK